MLRKFCFLILLGIPAIVQGQPKTDPLLKDLLLSSPDTIIRRVIQDPERYRLQIIYTEITREVANAAKFKNHYFNYDPKLYFNPASTVKLPLAILALEKLKQMRIRGIDKNTTIVFDSSYERQTVLYSDSTSQSGLPSIAHFIRKAFLISDNDAYNRLYQFVGQQRIHKRLRELGYTTTRIPRQFMGFTAEQNRNTNQVRFLDANGKEIYRQAPAYNRDSFDFSNKILIGKGFMNRNDSLVSEPFDFTIHNNIALEDLQRMLQAIMAPESLPKRNRFDLSSDDYLFLRKFLSQYPSETDNPKYDTVTFYDSYVKFFFRDGAKKMPAGVRVFNKVGWAYGFLTDVSYVVDFTNAKEYMLSTTIYVNDDGILNDNKYEYDGVGYPFLRSLGRLIYEHELKQKDRSVPNLDSIRIKYDKRDPDDRRKQVKEVDN